MRSDIEEAMAEGEGKKVRFKVNEIELELKTAIHKKGAGEGSIAVDFDVLGWQVLKGKSALKADISKEDVHIMRIKLEPKILKSETSTEGNVYEEDTYIGDLE